MPVYTYKARDAFGHVIHGRMEAKDEETLATRLKKLGFLATALREKTETFAIEDLLETFRRVKEDHLVMTTLQLSKMVRAGIPLLDTLKTLTDQTEDRYFRAVLADVSRNVEGGSALSEALSQYPRIFDAGYVSIVKAGETSGKLPDVLERIAQLLEDRLELKQKIKTALMYPCVLLVFGVCLSGFMVVYLLPSFMDIFQKAKVPLPGPTQFLYDVSQFLRHCWGLILFVVLSLPFIWQSLLHWKKSHILIDRFFLEFPLFGPLVRQVTVTRFAQNLETLLSSGVPILEALDVAKKTSGNLVMMEVLEKAQARVSQGESLAKPLKESKEFPLMPVHMIAVGEESGTLDEMLGHIASFYQKTVDHAIKQLTALVEPLFLILMGGMVGFIMASLLLPIFRMVKLIQ